MTCCLLRINFRISINLSLSLGHEVYIIKRVGLFIKETSDKIVTVRVY